MKNLNLQRRKGSDSATLLNVTELLKDMAGAVILAVAILGTGQLMVMWL